MARALLVDSRAGRLSASVDQDGFPVLPPTLLTIHRTSPRDEQTRQIVCALDGERVGQVLCGERLTIEILPGRHALRIHNTLVWKTAEFGAEPGEHVHFTVWRYCSSANSAQSRTSPSSADGPLAEYGRSNSRVQTEARDGRRLAPDRKYLRFPDRQSGRPVCGPPS